MPLQIVQYSGADDPKVPIVRRDVSGGMNNRQQGNIIEENQVETANNIDLSIPGQALKRKGTNLIEDLGSDAGTGAIGFEPIDGTEQIVVTHGQKLETSTGSTFTERKDDITTDGAPNTYYVRVTGVGGPYSLVVGRDVADDWTQSAAILEQVVGNRLADQVIPSKIQIDPIPPNADYDEYEPPTSAAFA